MCVYNLALSPSSPFREVDFVGRSVRLFGSGGSILSRSHFLCTRHWRHCVRKVSPCHSIRIQEKNYQRLFNMISTQSPGHRAGFQCHLWMWVQVPRTRQKKSVNTCQQWIGSRFCKHQYWHVFVFEGKEVPVTSPAPILLGQLLIYCARKKIYKI